jgi:hypothetical protein
MRPVFDEWCLVNGCDVNAEHHHGGEGSSVSAVRVSRGERKRKAESGRHGDAETRSRGDREPGDSSGLRGAKGDTW